MFVLVILIVLIILMAIFIPLFFGSTGCGGQRDSIFLKMNDLEKRIEMFKLDNGQYPETNEGFEALVKNPDILKYPNYRSKPYLKSIPKDTWKTPFVYIKIGNSFDIISYGADASRDLSFRSKKK
jgi:general secretion pathway protein G